MVFSKRLEIFFSPQLPGNQLAGPTTSIIEIEALHLSLNTLGVEAGVFAGDAFRSICSVFFGNQISTTGDSMTKMTRMKEK